MAAVSVSMTRSIIDKSRELDTKYEHWDVKTLYSRYEAPDDKNPSGSGRLYLPSHQREWSWKRNEVKKMRTLIDSVLHGYPIPAIILNAIDDGKRERWEIYDGRHRVETLWRFANNRFGLMVDERLVYYRDLIESDRARFDKCQIPVAITNAAKPEQLAEVFIRLNSGKPLTNADYCWASRDQPLVRDTVEILKSVKTRISGIFGGADICSRKTLPNWVGLFAGIVTEDAGNMTTSFERVSVNLDKEISPATADCVMDALHSLYSGALGKTPLSSKEEKKLGKRYMSIGFINAFFFADWLDPKVGKSTAINKWAKVIEHMRSTPILTGKGPKYDEWLVKVDGAQNLNSTKVAIVLEKVNHWIDTGEYLGRGSVDDDSDDTDDEDS